MAEFWHPKRDEVIILDWEEKGGRRNGGELWVCRGRYGGEEPQSQLFHTVSIPQSSMINLEQVFVHTYTYIHANTHKHCRLHLHTYCGN